MVRPIITSCAVTGPLHTPGVPSDLGAGHGIGEYPKFSRLP